MAVIGMTLIMAMFPHDMNEWTAKLGLGHPGTPELALRAIFAPSGPMRLRTGSELPPSSTARSAGLWDAMESMKSSNRIATST